MTGHDYDHADMASEVEAMWRVARAMMIGAIVGLLAAGGWWAADKTLDGVATYQGEERG